MGNFSCMVQRNVLLRVWLRDENRASSEDSVKRNAQILGGIFNFSLGAEFIIVVQ